MQECNNCEYKGYCPEICSIHIKQMSKQNVNNDVKSKEVHISCSNTKKTSNIDRIGVKTLVGAGVGILGVSVGMAVVPVLGLHVIAHAAAIKISAGLTGGGLGYLKGVKGKKGKKVNKKNKALAKKTTSKWEDNFI